MTKSGIWSIAILCCALFSAASLNALATDYYWNVADGDWSVGTNWTPEGPPDASCWSARIDNDGTARISSYAEARYVIVGDTYNGAITQNGGEFVVSTNLILAESAGSQGTYDLFTGLLSVADSTYIAYDGTGEFNQYGGTHTIGERLTIASEYGSTGTYNLSGGSLSAEYEQIGNHAGIGVFNQSGGTNTIDKNLHFSRGTYNLSGDGVLSVAVEEYIGIYSNQGIFNQTGGVHVVDGALHIGHDYNNSAKGTYNLSAGTLSAKEMNVGGTGYYDLGFFTQSGGITAVDYLRININGTHEMSGGILSVNADIVLKGVLHFTDADWVLNINGGIANLSNAVMDGIRYASFSSGVNTLAILPTGVDTSQFASYNAAGLVFNNGDAITIGAGRHIIGNGALDYYVTVQGRLDTYEITNGFEISNGGTLTSTGVTIDNCVGSIAASGGTLISGGTIVGLDGTGEFNQYSGTHTTSGYSLSLGVESGSHGTYNISGSSELIVGGLTIGYKGTGLFNQTGGTVTSTHVWIRRGRYDMSAGYAFLDTLRMSENAEEFHHTGGTNTMGELRVYDGTYSLEGTGQIIAEDVYIGSADSSPALFSHAGGIHTIANCLYVGYLGYIVGVANGTYSLSDGGLAVGESVYVGYQSLGELNQSGGTNVIDGSLFLGYLINSIGTYNLSAGSLATEEVYLGNEGLGYFNLSGGNMEVGSTLELVWGQFNHTDGTNTVKTLIVGENGNYVLTGGMLTISDQGGIQGTIDFAGESAVLQIGDGYADITQATFANAGSATFSTTANSFTLVVAGFNPAAIFGTVDSKGILYTLGKTLVVPETADYQGIFDIDENMEIYGKLTKVFADGETEYLLNNGKHIALVGGTFVSYGNMRIDHLAYINDGGVGGEIEVWNDFINESDMWNEFDMRHTTLALHGGAGFDDEEGMWDFCVLDMNSADFGATVAGLDINFAIGNLVFSGAEGTSVWYRLESDIYCYGLSIEEGALIDLNGYNIYYMPQGCGAYSGVTGSTFRLDGQWGNMNGGDGDVIAITDAPPVPEPGTIALLGAGALALAGVVRRRLA